MIRISFIAILIGSFSLALVTAIMYGFETTIHEKMQGIHAQIILRSYGNALDVDAIETVLDKEFPEIAGYSPSNTQHIIMQHEEIETAPSVAMIKGINPTQEILTSLIAKKIQPIGKTKPQLVDIIQGNQILIGNKLAEDLGLSIGDSVQILYTEYEKARKRKITLDSANAIVGGTFHTGIDEFDSGLVYSGLEFLAQLFPDDGITQINLKLAPGADEQATIVKLKQRLDLEVYSWKDLYPALVSALKLETYVMFFILALITLVACMNMISLLYMLITQKRSDIAILKAIGTPDNLIARMFMAIGLTVTSSACILGILLAYFASWLLNTFPFIELPDAYYVSHIPATMVWQIALTVFIIISGLSIVATWLPVRKARTINIADVLRFEG